MPKLQKTFQRSYTSKKTNETKIYSYERYNIQVLDTNKEIAVLLEYCNANGIKFHWFIAKLIKEAVDKLTKDEKKKK